GDRRRCRLRRDRPRLRTTAGRHLQGPAEPRGHPRADRCEGRRHLRILPVLADDHAGGRVPGSAAGARGLRHGVRRCVPEYRLAVREFTWNPGRPDVSAVALLRGRTLSDVSKSLGGDVTIGLSTDAGKDLISFTSAGRVTTSLLVEGEYPKVRSLFPESVPIHAIVETAVLREAVRRVSLVAERNTPLRFEVTDGMLTLHAGTGDDAQASEAVEATLQ